MSAFTVGSFSANTNANKRGQSFTANVAGNDGTGSSGGANPVYVQSASVGYSTSNTTGRAGTAYLYSSLPTLTDLNNSGTGALAASTGHSDGNVFGTGTFSRTFTFDAVSIDPTAVYYVLFATNQNLRFDTNAPYSGGDLYNTSLGADSSDAQFQVALTTT
jgi:hypothetical protein